MEFFCLVYVNQYQDFQEYMALEDKAQIAVEPFREQIVRTEEQMDEWGIRKTHENNGISRDQRARVLNTASTLAMFLSRRGVIAEQLQLNTTYSRAAQERMRTKEAEERERRSPESCSSKSSEKVSRARGKVDSYDST